MNGIEKITEKILDDARAYEKKVLEQAERDIESIRAEYAADSSELEKNEYQKIARDCEAILSRAEASGENSLRNSMLEKKSKLLDEAYSNARRAILALPEEKYFAFLASLVKKALGEKLSTEAQLDMLGEEVSKDEKIALVFSEEDHKLYADKIMAQLEKELESDAFARLEVADPDFALDSGVIVKSSEIELNCSLDMLILQAREKSESEVCKILFA